jgi:DNA-directed RNA polymerase specialized sigma24 family protein
LHGLDRATVEMIELRFRAGLTLAAIGQRLGLGAGAVHGRLNRAIARLRQRACNDD